MWPRESLVEMDGVDWNVKAVKGHWKSPQDVILISNWSFRGDRLPEHLSFQFRSHWRSLGNHVGRVGNSRRCCTVGPETS